MRRLFWLGVGAVAGASGTVWAERRVKARLEALQPDHLVVAAGNRALDAGRSAAGTGRSMLDAVAEGRDAMREREAELRGRYDGPERTRRDAPASRRSVSRRSAASSPR